MVFKPPEQAKTTFNRNDGVSALTPTKTTSGFKDVNELGLTTREDLLAKLGVKTQAPKAPPVIKIDWRPKETIVLPKPVYTAPERPKGGGGFLGALGDVIKVIDKPRALVVSTIKETGDLFRGDGFSASNWWSQIGDNMMMGEVLRDWDVDLPGPLDFVVGLGLDVALDPLTYLAAGTLSARFANPNKVADALSAASKTYRTAGKVDKADLLLKAAGQVTAKRSVLAAGDAALKEIGMGVGLRMTVPGTGRIGRNIIEKPLRVVSKKLGKGLDGRRIKQLPEANLPEFLKGSKNPWAKNGRRSYDFSKPGNAQKLQIKMDMIRKNKLAPRSAFTDPARQAMRMPVELFKIPGSANFVRVTAGAAGTAFAASASTKLGKNIGEMFGTQADYNKLVREIGKGMAKGDQSALDMYDVARFASGAADTANVRVGSWQHRTLETLKDLRTETGIKGIDYDNLMFKAAADVWEFTDEAGQTIFNPRLAELGFKNTDDMRNLHTQATEFWKDAGLRLEAELKPLGVNVNLIDFKSEFYVPRFLDNVKAEGIVPGVLANNRVSINLVKGTSNSAGMAGNSFMKIRQFVSPNLLKGMRPTRGDVAGRFGLDASDMITDEMVHNAAVVNKLSSVKKGKQGAYERALYADSELDEMFEELISSPSGAKFEYENGSFVSNDYLGMRLQNASDGAGDVRVQMERIGREQLGDDYKNIFSSDVDQSMQRYINQASHRLREGMYMSALDNAGITINIRPTAKGTTDFFGTRTKDIGDRLNGLLENMGKQLSKAEDTLMREQPLLNEAARRKDAYESAVRSEGANVKGVDKASARTFDRANESVTEANRQIEEINTVIGAINNPNVKNLPKGKISIDVFELLRPPTNNPSRGTKIFNKSLTNRVGSLKDQEQAVLAINDMAETLNDITQMRNSIKEMLAGMSEASPATKAQFKNLLDELDQSLETGIKGVLGLKLNYVDNIIKNDPGVSFMKLYDDLSEVVVKDTSYAIQRNGRKLSTRTFTSPVESELKNLAKRMANAAKNVNQISPAAVDSAAVQARRLKEAATKARILKDAKKLDDWITRVSEVKKLSSQLGEQRLYSGVLAAVKSADAGAAKIDEIAGITVIQNQIDEIDELIARSSRTNNLDPESQALRDRLEAEVRYLEDANVPNKAAIDDIQNEWEQKFAYWNDLYQKRKISVDELTEQVGRLKKYRDALLDQVQTEIIPRGQIQGTLSDRLSYLGRLDINPTATGAEFAAGDAQRKAISMIRKARAQNSLSDAYGGALNEYMLQHTSMSFKNGTNVPVPRTFSSGRAERAFSGKALVGNFTDDEMELMLGGMAALGKMQDPQEIGKFFKGYDKFLNWWKAQAVTSPGFFMRNQMGGMWINNQMNDVPMHTHARVRQIRKLAVEKGKGNPLIGLDSLIEQGKAVDLGGLYGKLISGGTGMRTVNVDELRVFKSWFETGMAGQGQVTQELPTAFAGLRGGAWKQGSMKPWDVNFKPMNWVRARNADSEFMLRGALAHNNRMLGGTVEEAWNSVRKYHFDYGDLSNFERKIKKVIPFWVWQRNVLPLLVESIGKNPKAWGRLQQVKGELELTSEQDGLVPDWFGENMGMRLPFQRSGNRVYVMPDLPFRDMQKITKEMESVLDAKGLVKGTGRLAIESALPPVKLPIELMLGKQVFGSIPFSDRYQQAPFWANAPVISQVLISAGLAKRADNGRLAMKDQHIYTLDQFSPLLGRLRRLVPNERRKQEAAFTTWLNTFLGTGLRVNTPALKKSEYIRQQKEFDKMYRDELDAEWRSI